MLSEPLLSLVEITALERSFTLGAPTLGLVARSLAARWRAGLRDEDTLQRFALVGHLARIEPGWTSGARDQPRSSERLPSLDELLAADDLAALPAEACFTLGHLLTRTPDLGGPALGEVDADALFDRARSLEPRSALFAMARFFAGERDLEPEVVRARPALRRELHARFVGRGLLGERLRPDLLLAVNQAGQQPRLM